MGCLVQQPAPLLGDTGVVLKFPTICVMVLAVWFWLALSG